MLITKKKNAFDHTWSLLKERDDFTLLRNTNTHAKREEIQNVTSNVMEKKCE